jgi:hypothetical protein
LSIADERAGAAPNVGWLKPGIAHEGGDNLR